MDDVQKKRIENFRPTDRYAEVQEEFYDLLHRIGQELVAEGHAPSEPDAHALIRDAVLDVFGVPEDER